MTGDTMAMILVFVTGSIFLAALVWFVTAWRHKKRRQRRLDIAYRRAQKVRQSGVGVQGKPYDETF